MAFYQIVAIALLASSLLFAEEDTPPTKQILYSMHSGDINRALELYQKFYQEKRRHDLELIQQIGLILLDKGYRQGDAEVQLLTLYGAGISTNEKCLYILENGMNNPVPQLQLAALNLLAKYNTDSTDELLNRALGSNHLIIRMEALLHIAEKKHPKAVGQIEALMAKLDESLYPLFPQLFAMVGDASATKALKRMLSYPDEEVRVAAIRAVAKFERDDLLSQIRKLAAQHDTIQQEACAIALGMMHDEASIARLETLAQSNSSSVRLAALQALYRLGKKENRLTIELAAKENNPFAIALLGEMPGSEETLYTLSKSNNLQIRLNAGIALLELQDPRCLKIIAEILLNDPRDLAFLKATSLSTGLVAWKAVPSAKHNLSDELVALELSLNMREAILEKAMNLPANDFILLAEAIFERHQNDLVPVLVELLENMRSPQAIALLKKYQQKAGAPLIRNYCTLALFNLKEEGPYAEQLQNWIKHQREEDLIRFRPYLPWEVRETGAAYELNPEEKSKFLLVALESFARTQDDKGIDVLLDVIRHGNTKNRYALAGLLIRSTM